ncbi:MAG: MFS transporter [Acidimicrobiia bacterium]
MTGARGSGDGPGPGRGLGPLGFGVLLGGSVLTALNYSLIGVALADIGRSLDASTADLQWVVNAFMLVSGSCMLTGAALADRFGRVRILRAGLAVMGLASLLAASADRPGVLIAGRALLGLGAAVITPVSLAILAHAYTEPGRRVRALAAWSTSASLGMAVGPSLGGILLQHLSWSATFLINVPGALFLLVGLARTVPESRNEDEGPLDLAGMALTMVGLGLVVWAIVQAPERGWIDPAVLVPLVAGTAVLAAFVVLELRLERPMLDLSLLRRGAVAGSLAMSAGLLLPFAGLIVIMSLFLRTALDYSPLAAGVALTPLAGVMMLMSTWSSRASRRWGIRATAGAAALLAAGAMAVLLLVGPGTGRVPVLLALSGLGAGIGLSNAPLMDAMLGAVPSSRAGMAGALLFVNRNIAQVLGVSVLGSVLSATYRAELDLDGDGVLSERARASVTEAFEVARELGGERGAVVAARAAEALTAGAHRALLVGIVVVLAGTALAWRRLVPGAVVAVRPRDPSASEVFGTTETRP